MSVKEALAAVGVARGNEQSYINRIGVDCLGSQEKLEFDGEAERKSAKRFRERSASLNDERGK